MPKVEILHIDTRGLDTIPSHLWRLLPASERQRVALLRRAQDRINRGVAWGALIRFAAQRLQLESAKITVLRNAQGKPRLQLPPDCTPLHFSLSHSARQIAIAVADRPVGIDIEQIRPIDPARLRRLYFPADPPPPPETDPGTWLHQLWTAKEALLKAVGAGLPMPLDQIVLPVVTEQFVRPLAWPTGYGPTDCHVASWRAPSGHVGALALLGTGLTGTILRPKLIKIQAADHESD